MDLVHEGDPLLGGVVLADIGCDTVILSDSTTLYINAHLKDWKKGDARFNMQFINLLKIVSHNRDRQVVLMMDANSSFLIEGDTISVYSKNHSNRPPEDYTRFNESGEDRVSAIITPIPTSYKMRGPHTAQLNKMLDPVKASIDHLLVFNGSTVSSTAAYTLDHTGNLVEIRDSSTTTTSPISIPDHALVISTLDSGIAYGTLNIKEGNTEDAGWAEFVPSNLFALFDDPLVKARLDQLMMESFDGRSLKEVKASGYISSPRYGVFDVHLPNDDVPFLTVKGTTIVVDFGKGRVVTLHLEGELYIATTLATLPPPLAAWIDMLVGDLNILTKRPIFLERGYRLLNFWHAVQTDRAPLVAGNSLAEIYEEWGREAAAPKVPIASMIQKAKELVPRLRVLAIQEVPIDPARAKRLIEEIKRVNHCDVYMNDALLNSSCSTQGAIVVFKERAHGGHRPARRSSRPRRTRRQRRHLRTT